MSDIIESKKNTGVVALNAPSMKEEAKTIIVVGVARGGTSVVAGTLHALGVFMGGAQSPVFEDLKLSLAFEKKSKESFKSVVEEYNQKNDIWAWKRPSSLYELNMVAKTVRNPYFIFVFRDFVSISNRNSISMKFDFKKGLVSALDDYAKIVKFIKKTNYPSLFVSSEKAVSNKEHFIEAVSEFCQLTPTQEQKSKALTFISPDSAEYLSKTRIDRSQGWVDEWYLQTGVLRGWAHFPAQSDKNAIVQVMVDNQVITKFTANKTVVMSKSNQQQPANKHGFEIDLKELGISVNDNISLQVEGDDVSFLSDPISCRHNEKWLTEEELAQLNEPKSHIARAWLQKGVLRGWAVGRQMDKPSKIRILVNGEEFVVLPASMSRPALKAQLKHPTGKCGFELNLKSLGVRPKDQVEVFLKEENVKLHDGVLSFPKMSKWLTQKEWQEKYGMKRAQ